jgi:hypothetical protein
MKLHSLIFFCLLALSHHFVYNRSPAPVNLVTRNSNAALRWGSLHFEILRDNAAFLSPPMAARALAIVST